MGPQKNWSEIRKDAKRQKLWHDDVIILVDLAVCACYQAIAILNVDVSLHILSYCPCVYKGGPWPEANANWEPLTLMTTDWASPVLYVVRKCPRGHGLNRPAVGSFVPILKFE